MKISFGVRGKTAGQFSYGRFSFTNKFFFPVISFCITLVFVLIFHSPFSIHSAHAATFQMQTGYYVGTGETLSITGLGFQPNLVIIKADTSAGNGAVWKSSAMTADKTAYFNGTASDTSTQITLDSDGFTLSSSSNVNYPGVRWNWIAFGGSDSSSSGTFCVGSYTGNGAATQSITSAGFQPDLVWIKSESTASAVWRSSSMSNNVGQYFMATVQNTSGTLFRTLDATGFTVGNSSSVNSNGVVYHYVTFKSVTGYMNVGSYTGNETDNRNITGSGFTPDFLFIKNATSSVNTVFNVTESYGDYSNYFSDSSNSTNFIQSLQSDGFQVGSGSEVNGSGGTIYWVAFCGATNPAPSGSFMMAVGSYSGNGTSQAITGLSFSPDLVIVKYTDLAAGQYAVFRTRLMGGATCTAYLAAATANFASGIISLDSGGFTVGSHTTVNTSGNVYYWEAFGNAFNPLTSSGSANFAIGAYTANDIDNRNITRVGFQPDFLAVKRSGSNYGTWRTSAQSGDLSSLFSANSEATDYIQALNTDGFQIGISDPVSYGANLHWWFAFKSGSNFSVNSYSGTGAAQNITSVGFQPDLVWVKRTTATNGVFRSSALSGDYTHYFANSAITTDRITAFISSGFSVGGSRAETNVSGGTYRYAAWKIPSTVTIAATDANAAEAGTDTGIFTITRSSENLSTSLTVNYTVSGTAVSGSDYSSIGTSVTIPASSTSATITVTPIDDSTDELPETVIVAISTGSDYIAGTPGSATVTIADDDPPTVTITTSDPNAAEEGPDQGTFTITRTNGDTASDLTVNFTVAGTAVSGSDYNSIGSSVTIPSSSVSATLTVIPIADSINESAETVIVTLDSGSGYVVGSQNSATVNITDNNFVPTVQFTSTSQSGAENIGSMTVYAQLSAVSGLDVTVPFTMSGDANNNEDYTITASPLTIPAGSTSAAITVTINDDGADESDETIVVTIGTPTNATASSPTVHTITVTDNDLPAPAPTPIPERLTIDSTSPSSGATNVSINTTVSATFSMFINGSTLSTDSFKVYGGNAEIPGTMKVDGATGVFTPSANLDYDTTYTVTLTRAIQAANYAGTTMDSEYTWSFTTLKFQTPTVSTDSATKVTSNSAMLQGTVNANGLSTMAWFEYGTSSGQYDSLSSTQSVDGLNDTTVNISANELLPGTAYYYRIVAQNSAGTTNGNEMTFATDDTIPPNCSISINNGDTYTNSTAITLSLSATDDVGITGYFVSTNSSSPSASDTRWISTTSSANFSENVSFTLNGEDGLKTIYVWYKDKAENVSNYSSDSIILDTTAPTVSISDSDFIAMNNTMVISLDGSASDNLSGISGVTWENSLGGNGSADGTHNWSISNIRLLNGGNIITVTAQDGAKNAGSDTITITYNAGSVSTPTPVSITSPIPSPAYTPEPTPTQNPSSGGIIGLVYDNYEEPLKDVEVTLSGNGISNSAKTNKNGYYEFRDVAPGNYTLTHKKEGYKTQTVELNHEAYDELDFDLITMEPVESGKIFGYVLDNEGIPVGVVKLRLEGIHTGIWQTVSFNTDGFFEFNGVEQGDYKILAKKKGYKRVRKNVSIEEGEEKEFEIKMKRRVKN